MLGVAILSADSLNTEMSILPSDVYLTLDLHDGELEIEDVSDNEKYRLRSAYRSAQLMPFPETKGSPLSRAWRRIR